VDELRGRGTDAQVLVVGQDESVGTARELGFHTLVRPNVLAHKLNDAFEHAIRELGATHVSFVGSDDFMHPDFYDGPLAPDQVRTSCWIAAMAPTGDELVVLDVPGPWGNAPWIVPSGLMAHRGYRPFRPEHRMSGMDGMLRTNLLPDVPLERRARKAFYAARGGKHVAMTEPRNDDPLRAVDFKGPSEQITDYSRLSGRRSRIRRHEHGEAAWEALATRYPPLLVQRMQAVYANGWA
jgi:hypothetical protein